jgi:hypothetical protein
MVLHLSSSPVQFHSLDRTNLQTNSGLGVRTDCRVSEDTLNVEWNLTHVVQAETREAGISVAHEPLKEQLE